MNLNSNIGQPKISNAGSDKDMNKTSNVTPATTQSVTGAEDGVIRHKSKCNGLHLGTCNADKVY